MQRDVHRVLISRQNIAQRLDELARQIADDHEAHAGVDAELTLVPVLTGSIIFVSDLVRRLPIRMRIHTMSASSYPGTATTSQGVTLGSPHPPDTQHAVPSSLDGQHVLIVDDILDSGHTLVAVRDNLVGRGPTSVKSCVLLRKDRAEAPATEADYHAFNIPDEFVVGYGLDYDGYYRNLPDIVTLRPEVYGGAP